METYVHEWDVLLQTTLFHISSEHLTTVLVSPKKIYIYCTVVTSGAITSVLLNHFECLNSSMPDNCKVVTGTRRSVESNTSLVHYQLK